MEHKKPMRFSEFVKRPEKQDEKIRQIEGKLATSRPDPDFNDYANESFDMLDLLYQKIDALQDKKMREKKYRQKTSLWHMPLGLVWQSRMKPWFNKNIEW